MAELLRVIVGICNPNPDLSKCFSSIDADYALVPEYSWSAMVITHEMGHLLGSRHTHACVWNGNNTAIDGCAGSTEGGCPVPGIPPEGGTIMSYCYLQSVGVNFNLGFGPQPGNVIRNTVNAAGNCLTGCSGPPPPDYCSAEGMNQQYGWIQRVTLGSISNISGNNNGYADFTTLSTELSPGSEYTISLTPGFAGTSYNEIWAVWIDYNGDLEWTDSTELVTKVSGAGAVNATFKVPVNCPGLATRMRVAMEHNAMPHACGDFASGEVEDYSVVIAEATCEDGIQNGDEEGVDCGGTNCEPCPTCDDGIQNGDEEGIDCGGSSCPPCAAGNLVFGSYFESGWDGWTDGGADAHRYAGPRSWEGRYSINLRDNSGIESSMTSPTFDATPYAALTLQFHFYADGMEDGEDFFVQFFNGYGYLPVAHFIAGKHFSNNKFWAATVTLTGAQCNFAPNSNLRILCDASDDSDNIYIDAVTLTTANAGALVRPGQDLIQSDATPQIPLPSIMPNPASSEITILYDGAIDQLKLFSSEGTEIRREILKTNPRTLPLNDMAPGVYMLMIRSGDTWMPVKFVKM